MERGVDAGLSHADIFVSTDWTSGSEFKFNVTMVPVVKSVCDNKVTSKHATPTETSEDVATVTLGP